MAFPKMGFLENMKDLITKGPAGMVNERMKEGLALADEYQKLDRSDPEAMKAFTARQNAGVTAELNKHFVTRNVVSDEHMAHIQQIQNKALEDQAEMYQMLKERREAKAAAGEPAAASSTPFSGGANEAEWPPRAK